MTCEHFHSPFWFVVTRAYHCSCMPATVHWLAGHEVTCNQCSYFIATFLYVQQTLCLMKYNWQLKCVHDEECVSAVIYGTVISLTNIFILHHLTLSPLIKLAASFEQRAFAALHLLQLSTLLKLFLYSLVVNCKPATFVVRTLLFCFHCTLEEEDREKNTAPYA